MITIDSSHHTEMLEHLKAAYPLEACGILAGKDGLVCRIYPVTNRLASPIAYEMDPEEQLAAMLDIEERAWEIIAIFHSHPHGPETPSTRDIIQAYYPEAYYVIVSWQDMKKPSIRAFQINDTVVKGVPYRLL